MSAALAEIVRLTNSVYRRRRQHPGAEDEDCPWERRCMQRLDTLYQQLSAYEQEQAAEASGVIWDRWVGRRFQRVERPTTASSIEDFINARGPYATAEDT